MPRTKVRKSSRGLFTNEQVKEAIKLVRSGCKVNAAAKSQNVPFSTLKRKLKMTKDIENLEELDLTANFITKQVIPVEQENLLAEYILECARMGYGLAPEDVRKFAYEYAVRNHLKVPDPWKTKEMAGYDWFRGFMNRHKNLSTRKPESCSVARAMAFNKPNIMNFFDKLEDVLQRHPNFSNGKRVYNLDETGTTTVGEVNTKVVAEKGCKQLHQIKSAERGVLVTTCCIIGANGSVLPPAMVFPRVNFTENMLINAYPGTKGLATKKGWMNSEIFPEVVQHFINETNSSKENPSLLILDNVVSHLSLAVIDLCRENGVTLLTLPPHTTHKTQPLDVGFFGPFQAAYNRAYRSWTLTNPGKVCSIYHVAGLVNEAISKAGTPATIFAAFRATGIFPFNRDIFNEVDYMPSKVTDNPTPTADLEENLQEDPDDPDPAPSTSSSVTPRKIRPLPKAQPRNIFQKPREKGRSKVATDSVGKNDLLAKEEAKKKKEEEQEAKRKERARKSLSKIMETLGKENRRPTRGTKRKKQVQKNLKKPTKKSRHCLSSSDLESNEESDSEKENLEDDETASILNTPPITPEAKPEEGDHVLVEFLAGKDKTCYVAKVLKSEDEWGVLEVSYYRINNRTTFKFSLPLIPDLKTVHSSNIIANLPKAIVGATRRQQDLISFDFDFTALRMG